VRDRSSSARDDAGWAHTNSRPDPRQHTAQPSRPGIVSALAAARLPAVVVGDADSVVVPELTLLASPYATGSVLDIGSGGPLARPTEHSESIDMQIPTPENVAVLFLDLQEEIVKNSRTVPIERLQRSSGALAKLVALHRLPAFLSAVPPGGAFLEAVLTPLAGIRPRMRTQTTAFSDAGIVEALRATGRPVLVLAGVASEIVVQRTALDAIAAGYEVQVAVDACGGVDPRTEDAAWRRIGAAGGTTTSVTTFAAELTGDFTTEIGGASLGILRETLGA
jgi:hypothetical protein